MSTITAQAPPPVSPPQRETRPTQPVQRQPSPPPAGSRDVASISPEASQSQPVGSVPSFASPPPSARNHNRPTQETPQQLRERRERHRRELEALQREVDRRWRELQNLMSGAPGTPRPVSADGPQPTNEPRDEMRERHLRELDALRREIERRWREMGGGIMQGGGGGPRPISADLPHRMPQNTETPEEKQARLDRECAEIREWMQRLRLQTPSIIAPEPGRRGGRRR